MSSETRRLKLTFNDLPVGNALLTMVERTLAACASAPEREFIVELSYHAWNSSVGIESNSLNDRVRQRFDAFADLRGIDEVHHRSLFKLFHRIAIERIASFPLLERLIRSVKICGSPELGVSLEVTTIQPGPAAVSK